MAALDRPAAEAQREAVRTLLFLLDLSVVATAQLSGLFWWQASRRRLRRVSRCEELNLADLNRIIVALNRAQILNARAATTTSIAALLAGASMALHTLAA